MKVIIILAKHNVHKVLCRQTLLIRLTHDAALTNGSVISTLCEHLRFVDTDFDFSARRVKADKFLNRDTNQHRAGKLHVSSCRSALAEALIIFSFCLRHKPFTRDDMGHFDGSE